MILLALIFLPLGLTIAMFLSRNMMLGFAAAMFWAILGGYAYTLSTATWDIFYLLFFASAFGMTIFCAFAAYGLREKRDTIADEELEKGEGRLIDESKEEEPSESGDLEEAEGSERTRKLRERAKKRRIRGPKTVRL